MITQDYYMLSFESTHAAMAWEQALSGRVPARTMPTLRQVSASCGISLRVEPEHLPLLEALLAAGPPTAAMALYRVTDGNARPFFLS